MKKYLIAFICIIGLSGCIENKSTSTNIVPTKTNINVKLWNYTDELNILCLRGVSYYLYERPSGPLFAPALKASGRPYTCTQ